VSYSWGEPGVNHGPPLWRDRSDTAWWLRWWRARITGQLYMRKVGRRRDRTDGARPDQGNVRNRSHGKKGKGIECQ
jgi:hypothetical protein